MWTCLKCGEKIDDQFDSCWKCAEIVQQPAPRPAKKPLEQFEWICIFVAAMPGILRFTGGRVENREQAAFRISLFILGLMGYIAVKVYQRKKMRGPR